MEELERKKREQKMRQLRRRKILEQAFERPFKTFERISTNGGLMLLCVGAIALIWANSPWQDIYTYIFEEFHLKFAVNDFSIDMHTIHWINDGLMAVFFLMAGLEIKREMQAGELSNIKMAALPIFGAIGGMILPIITYKCFGMEGEAAGGWGIPMATDIAFSIGILSLLGDKVPTSLKVFLTALAIVDDLGGVMVIAIFYTSQIQPLYLIGALVLFGLLLIANNIFDIERLHVYLLTGVVIWWLLLQSGIHSTIAGVLVAFAIPMKTKVKSTAFIDGIREILPRFSNIREGLRNSVILDESQIDGMRSIHHLAKNVQSPLQFLENSLHEFVNYVVLPLFAISNSGVIVYNYYANEQPVLFSVVTVAIAASLFIGKTVGITFFSWIAVKTGLAEKPQGSSWHTMLGIGMMGGIGFTMSLFIAALAFKDPNILTQAKLGIFIGSMMSGIIGYAYLKWSLSRDEKINKASGVTTDNA
ncbi:MAG: Na+/H+ antiporter NhaA [Bacteroidales bacterium]|nr:Na+/H+ antiporter NhaA [Bacteroidales bacterium]